MTGVPLIDCPSSGK